MRGFSYYPSNDDMLRVGWWVCSEEFLSYRLFGEYMFGSFGGKTQAAGLPEVLCVHSVQMVIRRKHHKIQPV